ncbi:MAG: hypothetical protein ABR591_06525, partial [Candidatus Velthaea sp.]
MLAEMVIVTAIRASAHKRRVIVTSEDALPRRENLARCESFSRNLDDPHVIELLSRHLAAAGAATEPRSTHALDLSGLRSPNITVWTIWEGDALLGVGALKQLSRTHGE